MNSWSRSWLGAMIDMVTRGLVRLEGERQCYPSVTQARSDSETHHKGQARRAGG